MMDDIKIYYGERLEPPVILENKEYEGYEYLHHNSWKSSLLLCVIA